jgi:hypothetical protein
MATTTPEPPSGSAPTATQWEASVQAMEKRDTFRPMNWAGPAVPSVMGMTKPPTEGTPQHGAIPPTATHVLGLGQTISPMKSVPAMT